MGVLTSAIIRKKIPVYPAFSGYLSRADATVWNADSGSTSHLTDQKQFLRNFVAVTPGSWVIKGIGNATALVHGYGDVVIDSFVNNRICTGIIKNVLYVPTAGINLISIGVVTAIPGMNVEFEDRDVVFKLNGTVEMNGQQGSDKTLYRLNIKAKLR